MTKKKETIVSDNETQKTEDLPQDAADFPDKFKTATGDLNTAALLKSYLELEKKMGSRSEQSPTGIRPDKPTDYRIRIDNAMMVNDPVVNQRLFDLGLTNEQVQGIYDLASDTIMPMIETLCAAFRADKDLSDLERTFGGTDKFNQVARQISSWGEKNLDRSVFETLSGSKNGIMTMYKMMTNAREETVLPRAETTVPSDTEDSLKRLMQDPRYWKKQDPELVKRVTDGFKRLYG